MSLIFCISIKHVSRPSMRLQPNITEMNLEANVWYGSIYLALIRLAFTNTDEFLILKGVNI